MCPQRRQPPTTSCKGLTHSRAPFDGSVAQRWGSKGWPVARLPPSHQMLLAASQPLHPPLTPSHYLPLSRSLSRCQPRRAPFLPSPSVIRLTSS